MFCILYIVIEMSNTFVSKLCSGERYVKHVFGRDAAKKITEPFEVMNNRVKKMYILGDLFRFFF